MNNRLAYRNVMVLSAISLMLLLDACVCRPVRVGQAEYSTPATIAELKASLP
ncbi:MAG: hypothetical protein JWL84_1059 [Rhodospirillales bacterium]|jgi:hypothetical protein|nr:hypothetical protein [Rhodospirillales bacterium]